MEHTEPPLPEARETDLAGARSGRWLDEIGAIDRLLIADSEGTPECPSATRRLRKRDRQMGCLCRGRFGGGAEVVEQVCMSMRRVS